MSYCAFKFKIRRQFFAMDLRCTELVIGLFLSNSFFVKNQSLYKEAKFFGNKSVNRSRSFPMCNNSN